MIAKKVWLAVVLALPGLLPAQTPVEFNPNPSRVVGHAKKELITAAPNLVEGREFNGPLGIAVDNGVNPPVLYVADTNNHRVLIFRNARAANGAQADAVIGQRDFFTTTPGGPGTSNTVGFRSPSGLVVDRRGNLYVVDSGNNRILRFARPYEPRDLIQPNMVIGQPSFNANLPNQGNTLPTAKTLAYASGSTGVSAALFIDNSENLWVPDGLNSRVLRFPASVLGESAASNPEADLVLGQADFVSIQNVNWFDVNNRRLKTAIRIPSGITMDTAGRLFVSDNASRVLVYSPPFRSGMTAARLAGLSVNQPGQPPRTPINEYTLFNPEGLFTAGNNLFVADSGAHRILRFDPFDTWPEETDLLPSPPAKAVFGQPDLLSSRANRGSREPSNASFAGPVEFAVAGADLFICDSLNHRILRAPLSNNQILGATSVLGQINFTFRSPNLVEGREMFLSIGLAQLPLSAGSVSPGAAMVLDNTTATPRLYVADTYNNRILGYADARAVKPGDPADIVIGQASLFESKLNSPADDINLLTDTGFVSPSGVAVDASGDLYVADTGNGRVLRFPKPFEPTFPF